MGTKSKAIARMRINYEEYLLANDDNQDAAEPRPTTLDLELRIKSLEKEKADMAESHRKELAVATGHQTGE